MTTMNASAGGPAGTLAAGLELCRAQLLDTQAPSPIQALMVTLDRVRAASSGGEWHRLVGNAREHSLFELLMQDPYTARAYQKPRGYAGDAVMLDYVYGRRGSYHDAGVTDLGMAIHAYSAGASPPARAVRWRRDWIASQIETSMIAAGRPVKVLSLACGHLREYVQVHPNAEGPRLQLDGRGPGSGIPGARARLLRFPHREVFGDLGARVVARLA